MKDFEKLLLAAIASLIAFVFWVVFTSVSLLAASNAEIVNSASFFGYKIPSDLISMSVVFYCVVSSAIAFALLAMWILIFKGYAEFEFSVSAKKQD